tara:strand:- start:26 stop:631 length:606 start_codon:yes stop_codon:yes gene_type:complete
MKVKVLDINNKEISSESLTLPKVEDNDHVLHTLNRYTRNKLRAGTASTKTRGQVKCSTVKAYKQKGTGNARRGAKSSPILRGGGVTFGPSPRSYKFKLNKKFLNLALITLLSKISTKLTIIDSEETKKLSTKDASNFLSNLKISTKIILLVDVADYKAIKLFGNCKNIILMDVNQLEPEILLSAEKVLITKAAFSAYKGIL